MEDKKTKKTSKRVDPYAKKETLKNKKDWAKNKLKGSLGIDALPMKNPDYIKYLQTEFIKYGGKDKHFARSQMYGLACSIHNPL